MSPKANLKASVIQNTGEDWQDIKLSVSNGNPSNNESYIKAQPWILNFKRYMSTTDKANNQNIFQDLLVFYQRIGTLWKILPPAMVKTKLYLLWRSYRTDPANYGNSLAFVFES
ncbi:MAG: DUF4139 domain-containing protein [Saprospiraceae bacterium]|nr:DUF4139 domain-containing protein [Saprospiraceae bacterium]